MTRLLAIPADPLGAYVRKGEVKERYFNPEDLFDEIDYLTLDDGPVDDEAMRTWSGRARYRVHAVGGLRVLSLSREPYAGPHLGRALREARASRADVIRCFDPVETGWWARAAARATGTPYVVSLHGNYDLDIRARLRAAGHWKGWLYYQITRPLVERPVLRDAAHVVCAYQFAARYARAMGRRDAEVIYNRVDLSRFRPAPRDGPFRILFVGRCQENKGQEVLIRAMRDAPGELTLVGDGPTRPMLEDLIRDLGLAGRVSVVRAVAHREIDALYARASCFASAILYGGIQIPHLEAMASGLPLVLARPLWEDAPEQMGDVGLVADRSPEAIAAALRRVAHDRALADDLSGRSLRRARELSGDRMEKREREMYERVLAGTSSRAA